MASEEKFCPNCDYAIPAQIIESAQHNYHCPRCGAAQISDFYSYNSRTHRERRESWERGEILGAPLPLPNKKESV